MDQEHCVVIKPVTHEVKLIMCKKILIRCASCVNNLMSGIFITTWF